ncbi:hypothetical protein OQA88_8482 [Cercophora sp. LCS_1]
MGKTRKSKRQLIRDEKRAKKRAREVEEPEPEAKRQRRELPENIASLDYIPLEDDDDDAAPRGPGGAGFEREFFGMLEDQEQEYFRHADELLELNDFPSTEERDLFLENVYKEAVGKELKLASSQSCSRLMERLILLSSTRQKKHLFQAFAGHFISLITHRFASHCCEKLFLQSVPVVTRELGGSEEEEEVADEGVVDAEEKRTMEELFLLTLDELEEHLSYLVSDRYGSHALRALLIVLSGRPLNQVGTKSLLQSKKKEHITVEGASVMTSELASQNRAVPSSFTAAIQKIMTDSTANLDSTALRVLAKHPTGNPTLQLLLELELSLFAKAKKAASKAKEQEEQQDYTSLVDKLIPDAPASFSDEKSQAAEFINSMLYDPIGSRLLETLITNCPGKVFKGLHATFFGPRIQSLLRNDIASYPAIRVLNRLSKEDLADAVEKSLPQIASFVEKGRLNVIKTFFERCSVRQATNEINSLLQALSSACGNDWKHLVPKLCLPNDEPAAVESKKEKSFQPEEMKNKAALLSHGSQLVSTLLSIPGSPCKAIQVSLASLNSAQVLKLATSSHQTAAILLKALSTPAQSPAFHKILVASMLPNTYELATSQHSSAIINAVIAAPSRGEGIAVPFHLKENMMAQLQERETDLRESWLGRSVWRTWKGDLWSHRRHDWVRWAKETNPEGATLSAAPKPKEKETRDEAKKGTYKKEGAKVEWKKDGSRGHEKGKPREKSKSFGEKKNKGDVAVAA